MKQTVYVYEVVKSPNSQGKIKMFTQEVLSLRNDQFHNLLGTIELDVQPIRKEVEKVIHKPYLMCFPEGKQITNYLPMDSYDITVTYKIKE